MTPYGAALATVVLLLAKSGRMHDSAARHGLLLAVAFPLVGLLAGALMRVPKLMAAQLLDRAHALHGRLAIALEFRALPEEMRTPMMRAAIDDAADHARTQALSARRALSWRWPGEIRYAAVLLAVMAIAASVEFRTQVRARPRRAPSVHVDPLMLAGEDIDAFREFARGIEQNARTERSRQAVDRFNRFVDRLANRELDRQDAYRQLSALQADIETDRRDDQEALREALRQLGERVDSESTRQLAEALRQADPQAAAEAMRQLARQLREQRTSQQQRQEMQRALQRATEQRNDPAQEERLRRAREEVERLLRQQRERQLNQPEQRLLQQRQRDLERLSREQQRREEQRRQLERLTRNMSQAMQDLLRDIARAAGDLEQGAEDLNRMHQDQMSEQQLEEMRQALEELRQRMREQNGQGGEGQRMRLERFSGSARGGVAPGGMQGRGGRLVLTRGGPGGGIPLPNPGGRPGQGSPQGSDPSNGAQAGVGHDERIRGAATHIDARLNTVNVAGQHRDGPGRSQIIRTAAQEGFTGQSYRDIHTEYWNHAREVVHAGEVPPGYRGYVRRYFQLIRPREAE